MAPLSIHLNHFDPNTASPELRSNVDKSKFMLLVTEGPLTVPQIETLRSRNVLVDYQYPNHAYVVKVDDAFNPETSLDGLEFVKHALAFPPHAVLPGHLNLQDRNEHEIVDLAITLHDGAERNTQDVLNDISALTPATRTYCGDRTILASVPAGRALDIAKIDEVRSIELHQQAVSKSVLACERMGVCERAKDKFDRVVLDAKKNSVFVWNKYTGSKETIGVCETGGLDAGDRNNLMTALNGRVVDIVMLSDDGKTTIRDPAQLMDTSGHGTHVAACVAGRDLTSSSQPDVKGVVDPDMNISGPASEAELFFIRHGRVTWDTLLTMKNYQPPSGGSNPATMPSVPIITNSWGLPDLPDTAKAQPPYAENQAGLIDQVMFNDPTVLLIFAAANDGMVKLDDGGQIFGPAGSKNALVVGSCSSSRPFTAMPPDPTGKPTGKEMKYAPGAPEQTRVANFSSKGPTFEGFLKPDVVAPGIAVLASRSSKMTTNVLSAKEYAFGKSLDPRFRFETGTSMSTPLVAGLAACLRQACIDTRPKDQPQPSGPLLKALIVNGTKSLNSGGAWLWDPRKLAASGNAPAAKRPKSVEPPTQILVTLADPPDYAQGYGMVSLPRSLVPITAQPDEYMGYMDFPDHPIGDVKVPLWTQDIAIPSDKYTIRATLAYNDSPGAALKADLLFELKLDSITEPIEPRVPQPWTDENKAKVEQPTLFQRGNLQKILWRYNAEVHAPQPAPTKGTLSVTVKHLDAKFPGKCSFAVVWWVETGYGP